MEAIVLAGGFGTRLQGVIKDIPKPMAPVAGTPFLEYLLQNLQEQGINHVVIAVHHYRKVIMDYFGYNFHGMKIDYSIEEEPLGTGGAIKQALNLCQEQKVFVLNGDSFFDIDLKKMQKQADICCDTLVIAIKEMFNFDRYGCVEISGNKIVGFREKTFCQQGFINAGAYYLDKKIFDKINKKVFSMEKEILEKNDNIRAFVSNAYFIDIGIPEDYERARRELINIVN